MKLKQYIVLVVTIVLLSITGASNAQIVISFNAPVNGQTIEGLSYVQIGNTSGEEVKAKLRIIVREVTAGNVLVANFVGIPIRKGVNTLDRTAFSSGRFSFGNNYHGQTVSQSGRFPEGDYEYCFEIEVTDFKGAWINPFFEACFDFQLQPLTPLLLINPIDGDENCNRRPPFIWQLPAPLPPDARCRLILSEVHDAQDIAEAINYNIPIVNQGNIFGNQLIYPASAPELKEGKRYVWQVTVYTGKSILKKSEIWDYTVSCEIKSDEIIGEGYRSLKETEGGDFYIANKILRFSFDNPYGAGQLYYSISNLSDPSAPIRKLPKLKTQPGLNKYDLDFSDNDSFKHGQEYLLKVWMINNQELYLRFLYKNE